MRAQKYKMQYELKTIADITKAVNEKNLENFVADFREFLRLTLEVRKVSELLSSTGVGEVRDIGNTMRWIDDGKTGLSKVVISIESE